MQITKEYSGNELFNTANDLLLQGKDLEKAFHYFNLLANHTLKDNKNRDILLFHLASVCMKQGHHALAIILIEQAMKLRDNFIEAYNNLGFIYKKEQFHDEAKENFRKALELSEKFPEHVKAKDKAEYLTNMGSMFIANGTPADAIEYFNKSSTIDDSLPFNKWNRSLASLEMGDYKKGFEEYDFGERQERVKGRTYGIKDLPVWDGKPDKNKTVVVLGEQGIGDEIMFASMIPDVMRDANVIFDAHPRLADLFRHSFPMIPVYGTRKTRKISWPEFHKIDAIIGIGSLAKFYRNKKSDFPRVTYLKADPKRVEKYRKKFDEMGDRPKIGISWKGGTPETGAENRTIPLHLWKDIFSCVHADFISLQYHKDVEKEVKTFEDEHKIQLNHWQKTLNDYDETAALVSNLDLVISVPQSAVHLAGALGTTTIQLAPFKSLWQVGPHGENPPWYGCVQNFWQGKDCKWEPVLERVKDWLCTL